MSRELHGPFTQTTNVGIMIDRAPWQLYRARVTTVFVLLYSKHEGQLLLSIIMTKVLCISMMSCL